MQRDVEVVVETMDRGGTFLGSVTLSPSAAAPATASGKPFNLALALLSKGLARLQPNVDPSRLPEGHEMVRLQQGARDQRLKVG